MRLLGIGRKIKKKMESLLDICLLTARGVVKKIVGNEIFLKLSGESCERCFLAPNKSIQVAVDDEVEVHFHKTPRNVLLIEGIQVVEPLPCFFEWNGKRVDGIKENVIDFFKREVKTLSEEEESKKVLLRSVVFFLFHLNATASPFVLRKIRAGSRFEEISEEKNGAKKNLLCLMYERDSWNIWPNLSREDFKSLHLMFNDASFLSRLAKKFLTSFQERDFIKSNQIRCFVDNLAKKQAYEIVTKKFGV
jgi:hypothetical protein